MIYCKTYVLDLSLADWSKQSKSNEPSWGRRPWQGRLGRCRSCWPTRRRRTQTTPHTWSSETSPRKK